MALYEVTREVLQGMIAQLDEAGHNHKEWHAALTRTLVCNLPADRHDLSPKAHCECRFGQWYYGGNAEPLRTLSGFVAMGEAHHRMHQVAAELLIAAGAGRTATTMKFDAFANALERLQLEIVALRHELQETLQNRDSLTGALTRVCILPALREQQSLVARGAQACAIALVDLADLATINDRHGHAAGDLMLATAAHYLIDNVRPYDKVFRYRGDEFLLCLRHAPLNLAADMAHRLSAGLAATQVEVAPATPVALSACFGVTALEAELPVEAAIDRAEKAVRSAKASGVPVRTWHPEMEFA